MEMCSSLVSSAVGEHVILSRQRDRRPLPQRTRPTTSDELSKHSEVLYILGLLHHGSH
jgi:hypothetical protein